MRNWTILTIACRNGAVEFLVSRLAILGYKSALYEQAVGCLATLVDRLDTRLPELSFHQAQQLAGYLQASDSVEIFRQLSLLREYDSATYRRLSFYWSIVEEGPLRNFLRYVGAIYAVLYLNGHALAEVAA